MKTFLKISMLFFSVTISSQSNLSLKINAGGPQLTHNGDVFLADQYFIGDRTYTNTQAQVPPLYQTERSADPPFFSYAIPLDNGQYEVTLHFADIYFGATGGGFGGIGKRVFDVTIEGNLVLDDYDIYAEVGGQTVTTKTYTVTVGDGSLDLYFSALSADGGVDQPKLSAFEVAGIQSSDTQSPTAPTLTSNGETDTTVDLSWSGATDDTGVTGYKIFKDGVLETTLGNVTSDQVTGLTASTTYSFTVTALDAAGNESVASNSVPVTTNSSGGSSGGGSSVWSESSGNISYSAGNVGIGTSTIPNTYRLAVNGKIITEELKVQLQSAWPDYVFSKEYDLPSLEEIQKHIDEKGHLPNIPSAQEMEANGLEVGEMNRLLVEKIEELTLYILQQEDKIKVLEGKIGQNIVNPK